MPCILKSLRRNRRTKSIPPPTEVRDAIAHLNAEIARQPADHQANPVGDNTKVEQYKAKVDAEVEEIKERLGGVKEPAPPEPFLNLGAAMVWSRQPNPLKAMAVVETKRGEEKEAEEEAVVVKEEEIGRAL